MFKGEDVRIIWLEKQEFETNRAPPLLLKSSFISWPYINLSIIEFLDTYFNIRSLKIDLPGEFHIDYHDQAFHLSMPYSEKNITELTWQTIWMEFWNVKSLRVIIEKNKPRILEMKLKSKPHTFWENRGNEKNINLVPNVNVYLNSCLNLNKMISIPCPLTSLNELVKDILWGNVGELKLIVTKFEEKDAEARLLLVMLRMNFETYFTWYVNIASDMFFSCVGND